MLQGISTGIAKLDRKKNSSATNENNFFFFNFVKVRPTLFYCLFYGKFFKKIESGGLNENKNKIHFLVESTKIIKIKLKIGQLIFIFRKTYF